MATSDAKLNKQKRQDSIKNWKLEEERSPVVVNPARTRRLSFEASALLLNVVTQGDVDEIATTLSQDQIDPNAQNADGLTGLHVAILENNPVAFKTLLERGADVNLGDYELWTPLHLASKLGSIEFIDILSAYSPINPVPVNIDGELPIEVVDSQNRASRSKSSTSLADDAEEDAEDGAEEEELTPEQKEQIKAKLRELYEKKKIGPDELAKAKELPQEKFMADIDAAISSGADLNAAVNNDGATLLHIAVSRGFTACAKHLLATKAVNVNAADREGWTPLHCAAYWAREDIVQMLWEAGANFQSVTIFGATPLDVAGEDNTKNMLRDLEKTKVMGSPTVSGGALSSWRKLKWTVRFAVGLMEMEKKSSVIKRKATKLKEQTSKDDMMQENVVLQDAHVIPTPAEKEPETDANDPKAKRRKRAVRRTTGVLSGPTLKATTVTAGMVVIKWEEDFAAEWFNVYSMQTSDPSSKSMLLDFMVFAFSHLIFPPVSFRACQASDVRSQRGINRAVTQDRV